MCTYWGVWFLWKRARQRFHKDTPLVITTTHKLSHIHECTYINPAPLAVNFKHFKAKAKVQESSSGLPCLWKQSKKFCFPQTLLFPVSLPDANWQTEGKNEINNHTNKGEDDVKQPEDKEKSKRKRKRENGSVTHQRSFIISWGTSKKKTKFLSAPLYFSLLFSLQFIWSCFFFAFFLFFPSPLEPDCGSCCLKTFGVESL